MANSWYSYMGAGLNPLVAASYRRITVAPICLNGIGVCSVYVLNDTATNPTNPFSANILNYISNALSTLTPQPNGGTTKAFVYLKGA